MNNTNGPQFSIYIPKKDRQSFADTLKELLELTKLNKSKLFREIVNGAVIKDGVLTVSVKL